MTFKKHIELQSLACMLTLLLGCGALAVPESTASARANDEAASAPQPQSSASEVSKGNVGDSDGTDNGEAVPSQGAATPAEAEARAYASAKPVFEKYCFSCHTTTSRSAKKKALKHLVMDTYPFGGHHADGLGDTILEVLGQTGKKATMPKGKLGAVKGKDLELIVAWAGARERAHHNENKHKHKHEH